MKNFYNLYIKPALKILGSIKFAFFLVICLIILSIIGSIISDASVDKIKYNFIISLFFNPSTDAFKEFASTFGLLNIYTSPLFITLLSLFTINLLICTFKLFPFAKKGFPFIDENSLKNEIEFSKDISEVTDFFYKEGWNVSRSPENNNLVKAEHHKPGRYGVIITHFGIIFIMIGAFVGHYMGFSGSMLVFENQTSNEVEKQNGEKVPLNFAVKLNDFNIEFYEGTKTAKAFTSNISIIENNNEVKNTDINVNHPLKYKDVVFYQASYGQSAHNDMLMNVFISKDNKSERVDLKYNKAYDFDVYGKQLKGGHLYKDENNKLEKKQLTCMAYVFNEVLHYGISDDNIDRVKYHGIIVGDELIFEVDGRLYRCSSVEYTGSPELIASKIQLYGYENGKVYIKNTQRLESGVYKDNIFAYDLGTKKARLCKTSFRAKEKDKHVK